MNKPEFYFLVSLLSLNAVFCSSLAQLSQVGVLSKAVGMGAYVDSQWGLAQFSLPSEVPCLCAFLPDKKSVVGISDNMYTCTPVMGSSTEFSALSTSTSTIRKCISKCSKHHIISIFFVCRKWSCSKQ